MQSSLFNLRPASDELLHVDLMRFVAAAAIVFHHSHEFFFRPRDRAAVISHTHGLALFVDFFFILSGFVTSYVYEDRVRTLADFGRFIQRRIGRLLPLHWLTLAVMVATFAALVAAAHHRASIRFTPTFAPACIADTALLLHSFIPCGFIFNGPSWSISAEMVMYVACPGLVLRGKRSRLLPVGLALAFVCCLLSFIRWHTGTLTTAAWTNSFAPLRALPSFLFGIGLFYNRSVLSRLPRVRLIAAGVLFVVIAAMLTGAPAVPILIGIYFLATLTIAADVQRLKSTLVTRFAPLGQLTYSIYMWHAFFILVVMNALGDKLLHLSTIRMLALGLVCYTGILVASSYSFFIIETPARRKIDSFRFRKRVRSNSLPGLDGRYSAPPASRAPSRQS